MKTDFIGKEIKVGSLIAFSASGQTDLRIGVVCKITNNSISYFKMSKRKKYEKIPISKTNLYRHAYKGGTRYRKKFIGFSDEKLRRSSIDISKDILQKRIVVIENPLFALQNSNIANQMKIIDAGKELGKIPADYEIGKPDTWIT